MGLMPYRWDLINSTFITKVVLQKELNKTDLKFDRNTDILICKLIGNCTPRRWHLSWVELCWEQTFFTADVLTCHSRQITGKTNNGSVSLWYTSVIVSRAVQRFNGTIQCSKLCLLWQVKISAVEKVCFCLSTNKNDKGVSFSAVAAITELTV